MEEMESEKICKIEVEEQHIMVVLSWLIGFLLVEFVKCALQLKIVFWVCDSD